MTPTSRFGASIIPAPDRVVCVYYYRNVLRVAYFFTIMFFMNTNELEALRARVARLGLSAKKIAQGSGLKPEWVQKFRIGAIADPGVLKVCTLRDWVERVERGEVTP